ncbi:MAG: hypothetical protein ACE5DQ_01125 [Candidatus Paceibacterota bacterium]
MALIELEGTGVSEATITDGNGRGQREFVLGDRSVPVPVLISTDELGSERGTFVENMECEALARLTEQSPQTD